MNYLSTTKTLGFGRADVRPSPGKNPPSQPDNLQELLLFHRFQGTRVAERPSMLDVRSPLFWPPGYPRLWTDFLLQCTLYS